MGADDEVWLGVLVHQPRAGLQPLPLAFFGLEPVRDHARRTSLQDCNKLGQTTYHYHIQVLVFIYLMPWSVDQAK
jgi:hypothetical protein